MIKAQKEDREIKGSIIDDLLSLKHTSYSY